MTDVPRGGLRASAPPDADDLPAERTTYAMRDLDKLRVRAAGPGESIGAYTAALLDVPLPWTRMRSVYRLLGLVGRYGLDRVEEACQQALATEVVDVGLIERMVESATEGEAGSQPAAPGQRRWAARPPP